MSSKKKGFFHTFDFDAAAWLSSGKARAMGPVGRGAYVDLLAHCWLDPKCSIPNDDTQLASLSGLGAEGWSGPTGAMVRNCFGVDPKDCTRLVNFRLLRERQKQRKWLRKSREGGVKSGAARRLQAEKRVKGGSHLVDVCLPKNGKKHEPNVNSSIPLILSTNTSSSLSDPVSGVDIYQAYPLHVGRGKALVAITKTITKLNARGQPAPTAWLLERVKCYATARRAAIAIDPGEATYTPHPATWFNGERYDDDESSWAIKFQGKPNGKHRIHRTAADRGEFTETLAAPVLNLGSRGGADHSGSDGNGETKAGKG